jgi:hypothetical protein
MFSGPARTQAFLSRFQLAVFVYFINSLLKTPSFMAFFNPAAAYRFNLTGSPQPRNWAARYT